MPQEGVVGLGNGPPGCKAFLRHMTSHRINQQAEAETKEKKTTTKNNTERKKTIQIGPRGEDKDEKDEDEEEEGEERKRAREKREGKEMRVRACVWRTVGQQIADSRDMK